MISPDPGLSTSVAVPTMLTVRERRLLHWLAP